MLTSPAELQAVERAAALERPLAAVEASLQGLGEALARNDAAAIEAEAGELHRALATAVDHFSRAARAGGVPPVLRRRLAQASGRVAAQREALARATASLDRAIDVLLPPSGAGIYAASGSPERLHGNGSLQA